MSCLGCVCVCFSGRSVRELARTHDLCMPGPMLRLLKVGGQGVAEDGRLYACVVYILPPQDKDASAVIPHVCVFARVSPQQKAWTHTPTPTHTHMDALMC